MGYAGAGVGVLRQPRTRVVGSMDGARAVLSSTVQGVRDLGVWKRSSAPRLLSHEKGCFFFRGTRRLACKDRRRADKVEVTFRAGKSDQNRLGSVVPRNRVSAADGVEGDVRSKGALEILLDLLDLYPTLDGAAPLMQTYSVAGWRVINRREATHALRVIVGGVGMDPLQYALHSGRIGGATQLAAQGATNVQIQRAGRWKSLAFMVYVRAGGEGADFVSQALTQHTVSRV